MSLKKDLAQEIQILEVEIKDLEGKRLRSMAALLTAVIKKEEPNEKDVEYFFKYNDEIDAKRVQMTDIINKLKGIL